MRRSLPVLLTVLAVAGCGSDKNSGIESATDGSEKAPAAAATTAAPTVAPAGPVSKDLTKEPVIGKPAGSPPSKLVVKDIVKGKGAKAKSGDSLSVRYEGVSFSTGEKFDASWDRGKAPFKFPLGQGQVIPGWDKGVAGMQVGGRRELTIPPALAYGSGGQGSIGPNETLVFVIDLVKIG